MAGFKNGSLSLKRKDTSAASDIGYSNLNFSTDNVAYIVDEYGIPRPTTPMSTGILEEDIPELIRTDNTIFVPEVTIAIYDNPRFRGVIHKRRVESATFTIDGGGVSRYVVVDWNDGTPIYKIVNDSAIINQSNIVTCYLVWNVNGYIHAIGFNNKAEGLSSKIDKALIQTIPYRRTLAGGLRLSEDGSRHVLLTSATVYAGTTPYEIAAYNSTNHYITETYHTAGNWTYNRTSGTYDNTHYDDGVNLQIAGSNKYLVRWVYRSIGDDREIFLVYGKQHNTLDDAKLETMPVIPDVVLYHCMYVGRIIIQYGASVGVVESAFDTIVYSGGGTVLNHNDLLNIQGGNAATSEYYHLSGTTYNYVTTLSANAQTQLGNLSATKVNKTTTITAGSGLTGGGDLSTNRTLSLAPTGTSGTYTKVTTNNYGQVTAGTTLTSGDIPQLPATKIGSGNISDIEFEYLNGVNSSIQTQLNSLSVNKVDKTTYVIAGGGLVSGGYLSQNVVIAMPNGFPVGTYTKVSTDQFGRITTGTTLTSDDIPQLPATKIGSGNISDIEFEYLDGVSANIQTQVNNKITTTDVKELYNWYSSRPTDCNLAPNGHGGLRRFLAAAGIANGPSTTQGSHVLHIGHDNTAGYDTQLASEATTGALRSRAQTAGVWGAWNTIWDSKNLPNPVSGSGASNQISYWTGTNSQSGDVGLTYSQTSGVTMGLSIGKSDLANSARINMFAPASQAMYHQFYPDGTLRWVAGVRGGAVNPTYELRAYTSAGGFYDTPLVAYNYGDIIIGGNGRNTTFTGTITAPNLASDTSYRPIMSTSAGVLVVGNAASTMIRTGTYIAVRNPSRLTGEYYEFWDTAAGWADIRCGTACLKSLSANTVPYLDANQTLQSSNILTTELNCLDGVSSNIQTQFDNIKRGVLTITIPDGGSAMVNKWVKLATVACDNTYRYISGIVEISHGYNDGSAVRYCWKVTANVSVGIVSHYAKVMGSTGVDPSLLKIVRTKNWPTDSANEAEIWYKATVANASTSIVHSGVYGSGFTWTPELTPTWVASPSTGTDSTATTYNIISNTARLLDVTPLRAIITDANSNLIASSVTSTELYYLSGATSNIQTQINSKLNSSSYTASDVLAKLLTVDGTGSGLNADVLRGEFKTLSLNSGSTSTGIWKHIATLPVSNDGTYDSLEIELMAGSWTSAKYTAKVILSNRSGFKARFYTYGDWPANARIQVYTQADGSQKIYLYLSSSYWVVTARFQNVLVTWGDEENVTTTPAGTLLWQTSSATPNYTIMTQESNPDLVAIEALAGTTGFLKKTAANTWALDTTVYQPLNSNLTALSTGQTNSLTIVNGTGSGSYFPNVAAGDTVFRWGSPYTETVHLGVMSSSSGSNKSSIRFSASSVGFGHAATFDSSLTADIIYSTNNGNCTNYKVGDDAWIGAINQANTLGIKGVQNGNVGYIRFGNGGATIGYDSTNFSIDKTTIIDAPSTSKTHRMGVFTIPSYDYTLEDGKYYYVFPKAETASVATGTIYLPASPTIGSSFMIFGRNAATANGITPGDPYVHGNGKNIVYVVTNSHAHTSQTNFSLSGNTIFVFEGTYWYAFPAGRYGS